MKECPKCGSPAYLATLEKLEGEALIEEITDDGEIMWDGTTEIDYDNSKTFGVRCRTCRWEYEGDDWMEQLS